MFIQDKIIEASGTLDPETKATIERYKRENHEHYALRQQAQSMAESIIPLTAGEIKKVTHIAGNCKAQWNGMNVAEREKYYGVAQQDIIGNGEEQPDHFLTYIRQVARSEKLDVDPVNKA
jgi:hypothetical protein